METNKQTRQLRGQRRRRRRELIPPISQRPAFLIPPGGRWSNGLRPPTTGLGLMLDKSDNTDLSLVERCERVWQGSERSSQADTSSSSQDMQQLQNISPGSVKQPPHIVGGVEVGRDKQGSTFLSSAEGGSQRSRGCGRGLLVPNRGSPGVSSQALPPPAL